MGIYSVKQDPYENSLPKEFIYPHLMAHVTITRECSFLSNTKKKCLFHASEIVFVLRFYGPVNPLVMSSAVSLPNQPITVQAYSSKRITSVEVLRSSQPTGSCRARSVYLTTPLMGWLIPLSG